MNRTYLPLVLLLLVLTAGMLVSDGAFTIDRQSDGTTPLSEYPGEDAESSKQTAPFTFRSVANETGLNYTFAGVDGNGTDITPSGIGMVTNAGVYVTDYNHDGWADVLTIGGASPELFENSGGEFHPTDVLPEFNRTMKSVLFLDFNGDGWDDLLFFPANSTPILLENDHGRYVRRDAGFTEKLAVPTGATAADFNGDGCLDLFVIQNGDWGTTRPVGIMNYSAWGIDNGNPNRLYFGECSGSFEFIRANNTGINGTRWSLAVSSGDLNNDGWPDIHVANDYNYDVVYMNRGNGTFKLIRLPERTNQNGMASELADVNGDRRLDIFVTNIYLPDDLAKSINDRLVYKNDGNNMLINQGDGKFVDKVREYNVQKGGWGWAAVIADFDNDGDEDLIHTTREIDFPPLPSGKVTPEELEKINDRPMYSLPIVREYENGTFHKVSASEVGFNAADGRGMAALDYDHDGDMDLVIATKSKYLLYENMANTGNAVQVRVEDKSGSTALGAEVFVTAAGDTQWQTVRSYTGFLSQDSRITHFGVADADQVTIRVVWPDGTTRTLRNIETNSRIVIRPNGVVSNISLVPSDVLSPSGISVRYARFYFQ